MKRLEDAGTATIYDSGPDDDVVSDIPRILVQGQQDKVINITVLKEDNEEEVGKSYRS